MIDHDPGDEDRAELRDGEWCPFCGEKIRWRNVWRTGVMEPRSHFSFDAAAVDAKAWRGEVLTTCDSAPCKNSARQFSREHGRSIEEKTARRERRRWERSMGYYP